MHNIYLFSDAVHTLMLVDTKMYDPTRKKYFVHWLVTNIESADVSRGQTILEYAGPTPLEERTYFFLLYEQDMRINLLSVDKYTSSCQR